MADYTTSLSRSFSIQARITGALLMREILTRYGRHNIGFLWLFVEPMLFTLGVAVMWTFLRSVHGSSLPILPFAVTGYSTVLIWRNAVTRCTRAMEPNLGLLYHRNVSIFDVFFTRILLEFAGATVSLTVILGAFIATGLAEWPADILLMVWGWLLMGWFALGLGFVVGALTEQSETFDRLWHAFTYLFFPISGVAYMVDWLPKNFQDIVLWIPTVHSIEMIRGGYYGDLVRTHFDVSYLVVFNLVLMLVGMMLIGGMRRKL